MGWPGSGCVNLRQNCNYYPRLMLQRPGRSPLTALSWGWSWAQMITCPSPSDPARSCVWPACARLLRGTSQATAGNSLHGRSGTSAWIWIRPDGWRGRRRCFFNWAFLTQSEVPDLLRRIAGMGKAWVSFVERRQSLRARGVRGGPGAVRNRSLRTLHLGGNLRRQAGAAFRGRSRDFRLICVAAANLVQ